MKKKVFFIGATQNSKKVLENIIEAGTEIVGVVGLDVDHPRNKFVSGIANYADFSQKHPSIPLITVPHYGAHEKKNINHYASQIAQTNPDLIYCMAWSRLLSEEILDIPSVGVVGRHNSLLPKRRGRAPVAWSLIDGLDESGVSLFWMTPGIDNGYLIDQKSYSISDTDYPPQVLDKVTRVTTEMLTDLYVDKFNKNIFPKIVQDESLATYTEKRTPSMGVINWNQPVKKVFDFIRGNSHPYPGAFSYVENDKIYMWQSRIQEKESRGTPGTIIDEHEHKSYVIQCNPGTLLIQTDQPYKLGTVFRGDMK